MQVLVKPTDLHKCSNLQWSSSIIQYLARRFVTKTTTFYNIGDLALVFNVWRIA